MLSKVKNKDLLKNKVYIDGAWHGADGGEVIEVVNPADYTVVGHVPLCGATETKRAITAAAAAFKLWSKKTALERSYVLKKWHGLIEKNTDDLALIMTLEQGKTLNEAKGEIAYGNSFIEWFAEESKRAYGDVIPTVAKDRRLVVIKQPVGVVGAITPWNFPSAMITRKAAAALAAGCTMVVKPASETPLSALALCQLAEEAGIPNGVLNVVTGNAKEIGKELTKNPVVRKITFTGSTEVGKILLSQSASTVKKVSMELGGNAPFIVFNDANIEDATSGAVMSKFRNTGQTCVCANRILVQSGVYDQFVAMFVEKVKKIKVGAGHEASSEVGPLINFDALEKVKSHVDDAVSLGAKVEVGGKQHECGKNFFEPTVISGATSKMAVAKEETFGPLAPIFKFEKEQEALDMANDTEFGLAAYCYTTSLSRAWRVSEELEYGMVSLNAGVFSTAVAPFGGVKESGFGREGSKYGLDDFLEIKFICMGGV